MSERIDHAARARKHRSTAFAIIEAQPMAPHMLAVIELDAARLDAQLAMVEQQRIANVLAAVALSLGQVLQLNTINKDVAIEMGLEVDVDAVTAF